MVTDMGIGINTDGDPFSWMINVKPHHREVVLLLQFYTEGFNKMHKSLTSVIKISKFVQNSYRRF